MIYLHYRRYDIIILYSMIKKILYPNYLFSQIKTLKTTAVSYTTGLKVTYPHQMNKTH